MANVTISATISINMEETKQSSTYHGNIIVFWGIATIMLCIGFLAALANGMVLYITTFNRNQGPVKGLDMVIKSLAMADMLFGIVGIPCRIFSSWFKGKIGIHFTIYTDKLNAFLTYELTIIK